LEVSWQSTIGKTIAYRAEQAPEAPAILYSGLPPLTFADLARNLARLGTQLKEAGIGPRSRIGIVLPRGPESALLSLAVCSNAIMLPINPHLAAADLEAELAYGRPDALIISDTGEVPAWAEGASGIFVVSRAASSFDDIALRVVTPVSRKAAESAPAITSESVAVIFRTSATTGPAKRVPITHENLLEMARKMQRWLTLTSSDRSTCILPIYYNAGFKAALLAPLLIGCSVAMPASTNPSEIERWVDELRPTWLTAAPAFLQAVLEKLGAPSQRPLTHSLRFVLSTASYLTESVRRELEALLAVPVVEFYGLCEAGMMTAPPILPEHARPGTVGKIPREELAIRGNDGTFLPPGQTGQIVVRGPSVTPGYLYDVDDIPSGPENGWLATGDLGVIDEDGFLSIVGRAKEVINRGGEKISPYDVEKALLRHPAVREAAAFPVPHPRLGENVAAAVTLNPGMKASSAELIEFIYDRLAPFQMPRQVHILPGLPLSVSGKISRSELTQAFASHVRQISPPEQPAQIQIAELWQRYLNRTDIGLDDDFFELGGDSLQATEMLLELERATRQVASPSDIGAQLTIRQLTQAFSRAAASNQIVSKVKDGHGTPLFLCHGDFDGWGLYALRLVELLKHDGPVFLLHSNLNKQGGVTTIEEMARLYIPHLLAAWPQGSFKLAGYCHGGLAAWEMVHQLENIGRKVECIVMIDTYSINARSSIRGIVRTLNAIGDLAPATLGQKVHERAMPALWSGSRRILQKERAVLWQAARRRYGARGQTGQSGDQDLSLRWAYYQAMSNYLPPKIDAEVVCLLSDEYAVRPEFAPTAWQSLARHVKFEQVPGKHNTCITSHVADLASSLNRHLAAT
jgi:acyl-CoA synthetase (AMP-forming)/AMP-acid ligase II/thioesterase domain-containing protein